MPHPRRNWIAPRWTLATALLAGSAALPAAGAQTPDRADPAFMPGAPLQLSPNARTYGGFRFAESMAYDEARDLYVAVSAGIPRTSSRTTATSRS